MLTGSVPELAMPPEDPGSLRYTHAYCPDYADALVQELVRTRASTVVCSGLETFRYLTAIAATERFRIVFDMHNVESTLSADLRKATLDRSLAAFAPLFTEQYVERARAAEHEAIAAADEVWACSQEDREEALAVYPDTPSGKIRVVSNVLDLDEYPEQPTDRSTRPRHVCFTGRFDYPPNLVAGQLIIDEIAPLLAAAGCDLPIVIAGRYAREALGRGGPVPANVRLVSEPVDVPGTIIARSIMAVPLTIGSGSRFKILEAFACGAPVVSTPKGVEGLAASSGTHYLSAADSTEMIKHIAQLAEDAAARGLLANAARRLVEERYSVRRLAHELRDAIAG